MKRVLVGILAVVGALALAVVLLIVTLAIVFRPEKKSVAANTVLELNLETPILEQRPDDPFAHLAAQNIPTMRGLVEGLAKAAGDDKVKGLIARMGAAPISMAQAQELRDSIAAFRARKKFAVAYSETFGEFGPGNGAYYLATAFDEIWLQPSGDVGLTGVGLGSLFLRGTFDKLGLVPRMDHRYEYKNAMNTFTEKSFTPAHREALSKVKDSWYGQLVAGIAAGRKLTPGAVRALVDKGPYLGPEALQAKLVDGLDYRDAVFERVKQRAGKDGKLLFLGRYRERAGAIHNKGQRVALIYGIGAVHRGASGYDAFSSDQSMGSDTVAGAFRAAIEDKRVKAILFRVDSPGGSYVASDAIWREVVRARKAGKPVVVSMSSLAGSGGYFVAMAADRIVAEPATITGSIGVLGGKILVKGLLDKVGVSMDEVHSGANARMFSEYSDYSKEEWARFQAWLDRVYDDFTSKVADGRKLPKAKVLEIAKGRIWTGEDAKANGLVDELGGYETALNAVRRLARIPEKEDVELLTYPRPKSRMEAIVGLLAGEQRENSEQAAAAASVDAFERLRPLVRALRAAGLYGEPRGVLEMAPFVAR